MAPLTYATVCSGIECMSVACRGLPHKACGNGWATNQPRWILTRLLAATGIDPFNPQGENT